MRAWWLLSAVATAMVIAGIAWKEFIEPRIFPKRFGVVVEDRLFRSGRIHPSLLDDVLTERRIDTIVTLTHPVEGHEWQKAEREIAAALGVDIARFPLRGDGTGDVASYVGALAKIEDELSRGRRVLVHCAAGTQRTGGVVFFYETLLAGRPQSDAYARMQSFDFDPEDNPALLPYLEQALPIVVAETAASGITLSDVRPDVKSLREGL